MSASGLHNERFVRTNLIQIGFADVLIVLHPPCGQIELTLRVLGYEVLDNLAVLGVVGEPGLRQVGLSDGAVTCQMPMGMRLQESGIDEVVTIVQHLSISTGKFFGLVCAANIGKHTILHYCGLGKRSLFVHRDDVA